MTLLPHQGAPVRLNEAWTHLPAWMPVPGMGALAVNSFVLKGPEPLLVDTGLAALQQDFLAALDQVVEPHDLKWIWLSHLDADHSGNLAAILALAPKAKVVTTYLGMGKMQLMGFDLARVHMIEPGKSLTLPDRTFTPVRPPYYDAPETIGFFDGNDRVLFAADSFGAVLENPVDCLADINNQALRDGMLAWARIDAPWLGLADTHAFHTRLTALDRLDPAFTLTGHLPVSHGTISRLTRYAARAAGRIARQDDPFNPALPLTDAA